MKILGNLRALGRSSVSYTLFAFVVLWTGPSFSQTWSGSSFFQEAISGLVIQGSDSTSKSHDPNFNLNTLYHIPLSTSPTRSLFKVPKEFRPRVDFWKKIYSKYSTNEVVLHDSRDLSIVYEVVDFRKVFRQKNVSERKKSRYVKNRRIHYKNLLRRIAANKGKARTSEEKRVLAKFHGHATPKQLRQHSTRVRSQLGQMDKFKSGISRSGRYLEQIYGIFKQYNLPIELTVLPHVESSFNYQAYSKAGAAGIWQFTRGTGRKLMRVGYLIDERRDPLASTVAAAKLLRQNYQELGKWSLAVTAYNHGLHGVKRGVRRVGPDLPKMIRSYHSRTWGFASKNFYSEFLAALELVTQCQKNFGNVTLEQRIHYELFPLPDYVRVSTLTNHLSISKGVLRSYNPALQEVVWSGKQRIPKGFLLGVPEGTGNTIENLYASIPSKQKHSSQVRTEVYRVKKGDSLYKISRRFGTTVRQLAKYNNLRINKPLRIGKKLKIPSRSRSNKNYRQVNRKKPRSIVKKVQLSKKTPSTYTVRKGDTLSKISRRFRIDEKTLMALNGIKNRHRIYLGQVLTLRVASGNSIRSS